MEPSIFAISQYLARSRRSPSSRLRLTSWGTLLLGRSPETGNSDQVRTRTRDLDGAPQTTLPRAYFLTRESRPRETALGEERAAGARSGSGKGAPRESVGSSTSHAAQFPADPKSRYFQPSHPVEDRGRRCQRGSQNSVTQPKTLTCRNDVPSQRTTLSSQTLSRRVRTPKRAIFPARALH